LTLVAKTYWLGPPFDFRRPPEPAQVEPVDLRAADFRRLRALWWTPAGPQRPAVAAVIMHPRVDFTRHYTVPRLVAAGIGCLAACSRNPNNDIDTVHEDLLLDVAAAVDFCRERGARRVVLLGNSGGGSLFGYYQAQAELPPEQRVARTPAGRPTRLPQTTLGRADGLILVAAHRGQGKVLLDCIDPAVIDEADPLASDPAFDMYDPDNGFLPPPQWSHYDPEFVHRYRAAQRARVDRLDQRARELIAGQRAAAAARAAADFAGRPAAERLAVHRREAFQPVMVIYRTMANLHYVDDHLDPSPREYGSLLSDRPDLMNWQVYGFARVVTPEAWLSTWSGLSSNADLIANLTRVTVPTLLVHAGRDREVYRRTDVEPMVAASSAADRTAHQLASARHYFEPDFGAAEAPEVERLMDLVVPWIQERFA
jgi:hypothetical protein